MPNKVVNRSDGRRVITICNEQALEVFAEG
jgi:hypothetical protein